MAAPPNPFDQAGVDKYLAAQAEKAAAKEQPATRSRVELPEPGTVVHSSGRDTDPAVEAQTMLDYWAGRGADVYADALGAIIASVQETAVDLEAAGTDDEHADTVVTAAQLGKDLKSAGTALYDSARGVLWEWVGRRNIKRTLPDGRSFMFKPNPAVSRRVDYDRLQERYPEAFKATVTVKDRDLDAPGRFFL